MKAKVPADSVSQMTELVLPNDTNILGKLMGGKLLYWMDIVASLAAYRHSNRVCVTAAVDFVEFKTPSSVGEAVELNAKITRAFTTSMEIKVVVHAENVLTRDRRLSNIAFYTFVAIDQIGKPIPVAPVEPVTEEEIKDFEQALHRREMRLSLAGRIKADKK
jgi:acyl-CoA hydrolase